VIEDIFLKFCAETLLQLSGRIEDCLGRLTYDQVWTRSSDNDNSVGNLVLHLCGNVKQWIGYGVGGQADLRDRDSEFAARGEAQPLELSKRVQTTVAEAVGIIQNLAPERLPDKRTIQNYDVTVVEAILHVVEHFSQHTGQIIFATKLLTGQDLGYYKHLNKTAHSETTP
jgi:uncharacterized damage-inducible protein DinB